tara:strand:+ start:21 stop:350 length:330 start_codon:yes stop_codon:yes gene_type:complete
MTVFISDKMIKDFDENFIKISKEAMDVSRLYEKYGLTQDFTALKLRAILNKIDPLLSDSGISFEHANASQLEFRKLHQEAVVMLDMAKKVTAIFLRACEEVESKNHTAS